MSAPGTPGCVQGTVMETTPALSDSSLKTPPIDSPGWRVEEAARLERLEHQLGLDAG